MGEIESYCLFNVFLPRSKKFRTISEHNLVTSRSILQLQVTVILLEFPDIARYKKYLTENHILDKHQAHIYNVIKILG